MPIAVLYDDYGFPDRIRYVYWDRAHDGDYAVVESYKLPAGVVDDWAIGYEPYLNSSLECNSALYIEYITVLNSQGHRVSQDGVLDYVQVISSRGKYLDDRCYIVDYKGTAVKMTVLEAADFCMKYNLHVGTRDNAVSSSYLLGDVSIGCTAAIQEGNNAAMLDRRALQPSEVHDPLVVFPDCCPEQDLSILPSVQQLAFQGFCSSVILKFKHEMQGLRLPGYCKAFEVNGGSVQTLILPRSIRAFNMVGRCVISLDKYYGNELCLLNVIRVYVMKVQLNSAPSLRKVVLPLCRNQFNSVCILGRTPLSLIELYSAMAECDVKRSAIFLMQLDYIRQPLDIKITSNVPVDFTLLVKKEMQSPIRVVSNVKVNLQLNIFGAVCQVTRDIRKSSFIYLVERMS